MPKFNLLYFKNLLDLAFIKFFQKYNDKFLKSDGKYILATNVSQQKIQIEFKKIIIQSLKELTKPFDVLKPEYYLIIGACMPKDNLLLTIQEKNLLPIKLQALLRSDYHVKYLLKEKDIKIDTVAFNQVCLKVFDEFFVNNKTEKLLGKNNNNVIFVTHNKLDCYTIFKVIKKVFGKVNCNNMYVEYFKDINSPIVAINELIDKYTNNKASLNNNLDFKNAITDIQEYLKNKIYGSNR